MNNGWIKLHRKIRENPYYSNPNYRSIWIHLLLLATHKEQPALFRGKKITLKPGQLITGCRSIGKELDIPWQTVNRYLQVLKSETQIETQTSNKNSLITILNWHKYQANETQNEKQVRHKRDTDETQMRTNKNVKNDKNGKNIVKYDPQSLKLAKLLYELIKKENPAWYLKPNWDKWAIDIDKIVRIDGRTYEQVEYIIKWVQQDDFWKQNILSPAKLRKQFNNLVIRAKAKQPKVAVIS